MAKQIGVMVVRMQAPSPTRAHHELIRRVQALCDDAVVVFGQGAVPLVPRDPMPWALRKKMLETYYGSNLDYAYLPDVPHDNALWSSNLDDLLDRLYPGAEITLYGSRDSFIPYYSGKFEVAVVDILGHSDVSATLVRQSIYDGTFRINDSSNYNEAYNAGYIAAAKAPYPTSFQTVDIAATTLVGGDVFEIHVLLGRKPGRTKYCFFGGFVDPDLDTDNTGMLFENAAVREFSEETSLQIDPLDMCAIGSFRVDDVRYQHTPHKIGTMFFVTHVPENVICLAKPTDDIAGGDVRLFRLVDLQPSDLIDEHGILLTALIGYFSDILVKIQKNQTNPQYA